MPILKFLREKREIKCQPGENLRDIAIRENIELYGFKGKLTNCGGYGQCATCQVSIENVNDSAFTPISEVERKFLKNRPNNWRLACQAIVQSSAVILTRPQSPPNDLKDLLQSVNNK